MKLSVYSYAAGVLLVGGLVASLWIMFSSPTEVGGPNPKVVSLQNMKMPSSGSAPAKTKADAGSVSSGQLPPAIASAQSTARFDIPAGANPAGQSGPSNSAPALSPPGASATGPASSAVGAPATTRAGRQGRAAAPASTVAPRNTALTQWPVENGGNGHYYQAFTAPSGITRPNAEKDAVARGGYLVTITSAAENIFVFGLIDDPAYWRSSSGGGYEMGPWIGGIKTDNVWQWGVGEPITYFNWDPTEPDGKTAAQNSRHFYSSVPGDREPTWDDTEDRTI